MIYYPLFCSVHLLGYDVLDVGWPNGVPGCPECLREWVIKHSKALEKIANPPTLGIGVSEGVATKDQLR